MINNRNGHEEAREEEDVKDTLVAAMAARAQSSTVYEHE